MDANTRYQCRPIALYKKTLYGQLQHIYYVQLPALRPDHPRTHLPMATSTSESELLPDIEAPPPILIAAIQSCVIDQANDDLDIHWYSRMGSVDYVDVTTIQCVVGRVKDRGKYAIIDRSRSLSRAIYDENA